MTLVRRPLDADLPRAHAALVARLLAVIEDDPRIEALLAGGSFVHGGFDLHSDLDFVLLVRDDDYAQVMQSRHEFAAGLGELLAAFTGEHVGEPRLLICLYGPELLHVDLKFATAEDLDARVERPAILFARDPAAVVARLDRAQIAWPDRDADWFEARAWIWLHYAAAKLGRGELLEALAMLAFFREQVLGPMLHRRAQHPQRGVRRIEQHDLDPDGRLAATVSLAERDALRAALHAAIDLYMTLREDQPPQSSTPRMPKALLDYLGD